MQRDFHNILGRFYEKLTNGNKHSQILRLALDRYLNYAIQEEEKIIREKEREGSDYRSIVSANSNHTISNYHKIKKIFYSNNVETAVLFSYLLDTLKRKETTELKNFFVILF